MILRGLCSAVRSISQLDAVHLNSFLSYISLTPCLQSPPADWKTHKLSYTHTHRHFLSPAALLQFLSHHASLRLITALQPLPSSLSPNTGPWKKKKGKRPFSPSPWQPLSSSPFCTINQTMTVYRRGTGTKYHFQGFGVQAIFGYYGITSACPPSSHVFAFFLLAP